jgi:cytochrome bd-type quinol oxidase subunit 2
MTNKTRRIVLYTALAVMLALALSVPALASGDVSSAIEQTWNSAKTQVQSVVKVGTSYFEYRKHGQFEFAAPAILFACLIFTLTAPLYIWTIL